MTTKTARRVRLPACVNGAHDDCGGHRDGPLAGDCACKCHTEVESPESLPPAAVPAGPAGMEFAVIPLDRLMAHPENPRGPADIDEDLVASIKAQGIHEPLIVVPRPDAPYLVLAGHRRLVNAWEAGIAGAPCVVRHDIAPDDHATQLEIMLTENLQRADLPPLAEARGMSALVELGYSQRRIAERVGRSQAHVSKRLGLLELPESAQRLLSTGRLSVSDATSLTRLRDEPEVLATISEAIAEVLEADPESDPRDLAVEVDGTYYDTASDAIEDRVAEAERRRAIAAARLRLEAEGVAVVEWAPMGAWGHEALLAGQERYHRLPRDIVNQTPEEHAGQPCHGGSWTGQGTVVYLCTDARQHATPEETAAGAADVADHERFRAENAARNVARRDEEAKAQEGRLTAARARAKVIREVLDDGLAGPAAADLLTPAVRQLSIHHSAVKVACQMIGVEPVDEQTAWGETRKNYRLALVAHAGASRPEAARALLALVLATGESEMAAYRWSGTPAVDHLELLVRAGYELTDYERDRLAAETSEEPDTEQLALDGAVADAS